MWKLLTKQDTERKWRVIDNFASHGEAIEEMHRRSSENYHRTYVVATQRHLDTFQIKTLEGH